MFHLLPALVLSSNRLHYMGECRGGGKVGFHSPKGNYAKIRHPLQQNKRVSFDSGERNSQPQSNPFPYARHPS